MKRSKKLAESYSLMKRMDEHMTLNEAEQYKISCLDELNEFLWIKPSMTGLKVDIFVDDGGSYERNNHLLLLFARNDYYKSGDSFIPFSISNKPYVMDDNMEFNISYDDIFDIQDFIQNNLTNLILLSQQKISQEDFISQLNKTYSLVVENKELVIEMATLRKDDSKLPVDLWLDEGATYIGHAPRIKFRASNEQHTTREYSSMIISNPPVIENLPSNCPIRIKDMEKIKNFVINNMDLLLKLANNEIDYTTQFKPNMRLQ